MNENENIGFEEFEAAFDDDYQTTDPEAGEETEETGQDIPEEPEDDGGAEDGEEAGEGEPAGDPTKAQEQTPAAETFTLKVNKEERIVSRDEVISLAQKGADYDRVKEQLAESKAAAQASQERMDKYQGAMEILEMISTQSGQSIDELAEQLHLNLLMKGGKTESEAKAELRAMKAEAKLKAVQEQEAQKKTAAEDSKARADREVAEFRKKFPGVELTEQLCNALMPDVQGGVSLSEAYMKHQLARKDAEAAELKRQLEAEKQNKKNRANTPGSQKDSGGRRGKNDFDDFMSAFD